MDSVSFSDIACILVVFVGIWSFCNYIIPRNGCRRLAKSIRYEAENHAVSVILQVARISPNTSSNYQKCIDGVIAVQQGVHLTVLFATPNDVRVKVSWIKGGDARARVPIQWVNATPKRGTTLPKTVGGSQTAILARPIQETSIAVNIPGDYTDSLTLTPLPPPPKPCGGIANALAPYVPSGNKFSDNFRLSVPPCGQFKLTAFVSDYRWGPNGPIGPEIPPTLHELNVTKTLCVERPGPDAVGPFYRVHIDRGCGSEETGGIPQVYFLRGTGDFSDPARSNWRDLWNLMEARNKQLGK